MAGHHIIVTQLFHPPHESPELDPVVAVDAGIRRSTLDVGIHKSLDDFFLKFIFKVQYIVGHVQGLGDKPGILHILQGTAGFLRTDSDLFIIVKLHCHSHTGVTLLLHQTGRHAGIHSAAHGDQRLFSILHRLTSFPTLSVGIVYFLFFVLSIHNLTLLFYHILCRKAKPHLHFFPVHGKL